MSDTEAPRETKSLSIATPRRAEVKKTVGSGQVRQSFSHGRSKTVQVEVKKKRTVARGAVPRAAAPQSVAPQGAAPQSSPPQSSPPQSAPPGTPHSAPPVSAVPVSAVPVSAVPVRAAPVASRQAAPPPRALDAGEGEPAKVRVMLRTLTSEEKDARARALEGAIKADEEVRNRAEAETTRRVEEEAQFAREREVADQRGKEEEERKRVEAESRRKAEEQAALRLQEAPAEGATDDAEVRRRPGRPVEKQRVAPQRRMLPRRRAGKLTMAQALNENERVRSLASVRRARERERRAAAGEVGPPEKIIRDVVIPESITVQELANRMAERGVDVVRSLMNSGVMVTVNQEVDADTAELVVAEFGHRYRRVSEADVEIGLDGGPDDEALMLTRAPVVTVMGHVDHGKTSLLDALRETAVAAGEAGGITQHIGAYQVRMSSGQTITFLDTPGHAAFTAMRARGAGVTDIVVLVVAADDGIMPQTIEAIDHARAAGVPIIVAINKMDLPDANPDRVRRDLLQHQVVVEQMGGDTQAVEISATEGTNLDRLEEVILLQAELLELRANPQGSAHGAIVESRVDRGRGITATALVQRGTLRVGDIIVAGGESGRVRALMDHLGKPVDEAGPSTPVEVLGLNGLPFAGDEFAVVENESRAREVAEFRTRRARSNRIAGPPASLEQMFSKIQDGEAKEFPVLIKADVHGSLEAILGAIAGLTHEEVAVRVLHSGVGGIRESDVDLARASGALVVGFNVRPNKQARELARSSGTEIRHYSVIYELVDELRAILSGMLAPQVNEHFLGNAEVLEVFRISKVGRVAGSRVSEGMMRRTARVRLLRDNVVIHEGTLSALKRFKEDAREVREGLECGISFDNFQDLKAGDVIEAFEVEEVARTL